MKKIKVFFGMFLVIVMTVFTNQEMVSANFTVIFDGVPYEFISSPDSVFCCVTGDDMYANNGLVSDYARILAADYALSRARTKYGYIEDSKVYVVSGEDLMLAPGYTPEMLSKSELREAKQIAAKTAAEAKAAHEAYLARKAAGLTIVQATSTW